MDNQTNNTQRASTVQDPVMEVPLSRPDITTAEIAAVEEVLKSPQLALGPTLKAFEHAFAVALDRQYAIAVNSGTSGLFLALSALEIGPGDEVITPPFTFIASATSIMMTGAKPVFVDIDPISLNLDPTRVEAAITSRTRAILPVEVFGNPVHMDSIRRLADQHRLAVIEDSCEALGSTLEDRPAGSFGDLSIFAFYPNKQITTGEGGLILTDNMEWAQRCVSLRNQGRAPGNAWLSHERLGYNFRMSDINAALGQVQLGRLAEIKAKRKQVAQWYLDRLIGDNRLRLPAIPPTVDMSWFVFVVQLTEAYQQTQRDTLLRRLRQRGIQTNNYFPPVHLQPFIAQQYGYHPGDFPITEAVAQRTIALPFFNNLQKEQVDYVCTQLQDILDSL